MARCLAVTKMQGTLNDFIVLDNRQLGIGDIERLGRFLCNRHACVGADGLLVVEHSVIADVRMRVINVDGSEAEMCGNGIRCVVRYLAEEEMAQSGNGIAVKNVFSIETLAGIIETRVIAWEPEFLVRAAMGVPVIERRKLPFSDGVFVSLGNPHVVLFEDAGIDTMDLEGAASLLEGSALFPDGVNVHGAVKCGEHALEVRHWERGVGATMSCGTGAVACAVSAIARGLVQSPAEVRVPGGKLTVEWAGSGVAYMTGPAVRTFDANVYLSE